MALVTDYMNASNFQSSKEAEDAFQLIKVRLTTALILVLLDFLSHLSCIAMLQRWELG